jgi:hypothetical protein
MLLPLVVSLAFDWKLEEAIGGKGSIKLGPKIRKGGTPDSPLERRKVVPNIG